MNESLASIIVDATRGAAVDVNLIERIWKIASTLRELRVRRLLTASIAPGVSLAWSGRSDSWRFIVRDGESVTPLLDLSREERIEAFSSGAMEKIVRQVTS